MKKNVVRFFLFTTIFLLTIFSVSLFYFDLTNLKSPLFAPSSKQSTLSAPSPSIPPAPIGCSPEYGWGFPVQQTSSQYISSFVGSSLSSIDTDAQGNIYFLWSTGFDLHFKKLNKDGATVIADRLLISNNAGVDFSIGVAPNGKIHIVFDSPYNRDGVHYLVLNADGSIAIPESRISAQGIFAYGSRMGIDKTTGNVNLFWIESVGSGQNTIQYLKYSQRNSLSSIIVQPASMLTMPYYGASAIVPDSYDVAVDSMSNIHLTLNLETYNPSFSSRIYYMKMSVSNNQPIILLQPTIIDNGLPSDGTMSPTIAIDSQNRVHIAWLGIFYPYYSPGYIMHTMLDINGNTTLDDLSITSTYYSGGPLFNFVAGPIIAIDSNDHVHFAWEAVSSIGYEIHYAALQVSGTNRSITVPETPIVPAISRSRSVRTLSFINNPAVNGLDLVYGFGVMDQSSSGVHAEVFYLGSRCL